VALHGEMRPRFTGQVAWRALVPGRGEPAEAQVFMGPGRHLVAYPLRGGALVNLVAVEERTAWAEEGWNHRGEPGEMRRAFAGFGGPVSGWLAQVEECALWGLFRHPVASRWHGPGAVLLGDAAHPTLPFLAQGACMALEDAWVLAECLGREGSDAAAFASFQAARRDRVVRIVNAATANARNYHLRGPARAVAHAGLRAIGRAAPGAMLARFDWLYGHDVTA
jgi:salicylate hydroxylase